MFNVYVPHFVCENLLAHRFSFLNESDIFTFIYYMLCSLLYYRLYVCYIAYYLGILIHDVLTPSPMFSDFNQCLFQLLCLSEI